MNNPQNIYGLNAPVSRGEQTIKKVNFENNTIKNGFYTDPYNDNQIEVQD